jgi:hypothetical protein
MTIIIVGGIINTSIWQIFTKATMDKAGPSNISIIEYERELSKMPRSLENLLMSIPEGVLSKKEPGLRTMPLIIFS